MHRSLQSMLGPLILTLVMLLPVPSAWAQGNDSRQPITWYTQASAPRRIADSYNETSKLFRLVVVQVQNAEQLLNHIERGLVDLVFLDPALYAQVVDSGHLANLDPWIQRDPAFRSYQSYLDMVRDERGKFIIPLERVPFLIYAHKHALEEAGIPAPTTGWTWDDYIDLTWALTNPTGDRYGVAVLNPFTVWTIPFLQQRYDLLTSPYDHFRPGLQVIYNLIHVYDTHPPVTVRPWSRSDLENQFLNARVATTIDDSSLAQKVNFEQKAVAAGSWFHPPEIRRPEQDWVILPLPVPHANVPAASVGSLRYAIGMAVTSQHPFEAWEIIRWLTSSEGAAALLDEGDMIPVFMHDENLPLARQLHGDAAHEFFREPFYPMGPYLPSAFDKELSGALHDISLQYLMQEISLDQAIDEMERARIELKNKHGK